MNHQPLMAIPLYPPPAQMALALERYERRNPCVFAHVQRLLPRILLAGVIIVQCIASAVSGGLVAIALVSLLISMLISAFAVRKYASSTVLAASAFGNAVDTNACDTRGAWLYCSHCEAYTPPRTYHCRRHGHCMYMMDHCCAPLDACIGAANFGWWLMLLVEATLLYVLLLMVTHRAGATFQTIGAIVGLCISLYMLLRQMDVMLRNTTYVEMMRCAKQGEIGSKIRSLDNLSAFVHDWSCASQFCLP